MTYLWNRIIDLIIFIGVRFHKLLERRQEKKIEPQSFRPGGIQYYSGEPSILDEIIDARAEFLEKNNSYPQYVVIPWNRVNEIWKHRELLNRDLTKRQISLKGLQLYGMTILKSKEEGIHLYHSREEFEAEEL